ncbi:tripartite motif-containing protein 16-like isoform X1 [Esox lucius]|uniref:tripartite motif-containing protein 16-like isoform X1 n=2 Tax=Esox lucius TaxID=8010 RepID=UPI000576675A|nr:tripartite motif-containing protein 16-like isoform X1 [Esox lucius]XP_010863378.1 tripartite motif-containing protein 16-like isoform X1 [Esox lucius]
MSHHGVLLDEDQFCCSICLDLLKEPVTTACGHSYCRSCIEGYWDRNILKGVYSCPQCRQTFTPRPTLRKNNMLAEVVDKLKKTGLQTVSPALYSAEPGDVVCDFCTGTRKQKALMSCLVCLASYCETHLQPHYESTAFKKHKLIKATTQLQEKICLHHEKLLEVFCRTDQQCICTLCVMDEHKGHDTVSAAAERTEKQRQLVISQQKVHQRVQEREKEVNKLQQAVESLKRSAQTAVEDSEKVFTELILSIERRCSEVKELIRAQEKTQVSQAEGLLEKLKQEIAELRSRSTELEKFSHIEDDIHFLKGYQSLSSTSVSSDLPSITVRPLQYFGYVSETVSELREKLEDVLKGEWTQISTTVKVVDVLPPDPKTREQFLQYSFKLTLDPNTVCEELFLSEGYRKVTFIDQAQTYPHHPDRFTNYYQVLCREGLTGRCYWEVEWSGNWVHTAVSYKDINRTRPGNAFGSNNMSWGLGCSNGEYCFIHNNIKTNISGPQSSRIGVYLDHKAGTLSFYSVSDTMTLLHRVQTTFTQPLYPGFRLSRYNDTAELCKLWQGPV